MTTDTKTARLLIVEDEPSLRLLLTHLLRDVFTVEVASSYTEALNAAIRTPFDLLLLDINLGECRSGVDVLDAVRRLPHGRTTPALACTAYATHYNERIFLDQGFDGCIPKPFTAAALVERVKAALEGDRPSASLPAYAAEAGTRRRSLAA